MKTGHPKKTREEVIIEMDEETKRLLAEGRHDYSKIPGGIRNDGVVNGRFCQNVGDDEASDIEI